MGDRVSISFKDKDGDESPSIFHHWGGTWFPQVALHWMTDFHARIKKEKGRVSDPTSIMESRNLMVQFIGELRQHKQLRECTGFEKTDGESDMNKPIVHDTDISHSIYLGKEPNDGDNSDNGHYIIHTHNLIMINDRGETIARKDNPNE